MWYTHGDHLTRLYSIWKGMKTRCVNKNDSGFHNYGGKGISVCDEWQTFPPFRKWAFDNGYSDDLEIDRIDNSGDYTPENCRWVTRKVNARNRSTNASITAFGETKLVCEWLEDSRCVVPRTTLMFRLIKLKMSPEEALTKKARAKGVLFFAFGEGKILDDWSRDERCQVSRTQLYRRVNSGMLLELALTKPSRSRR
jgi:hypothetical protein